MFGATEATVLFCVITGDRFIGFTVGREDDEGKLAEEPILGEVCGSFTIFDGFAVAFKFVLLWKSFCWYY